METKGGMTVATYVTKYKAWKHLREVLGERMWSVTHFNNFVKDAERRKKLTAKRFGARDFYEFEKIVKAMKLPAEWTKEIGGGHA